MADVEARAWAAGAAASGLERVPEVRARGEDVAQAMTEELEEARHAPRCPCLGCQARRWLSYRPDGAPATLKIAIYGEGGGGSGEPDRAYDRVVSEADMELALRKVGRRRPFLAYAGQLWRTLPPPPGTQTRLSRVLNVLERRPEWWAERDGEGARETLFRLLDELAVEMALEMGLRMEALPGKPVKVPQAPPGWREADATT